MQAQKLEAILVRAEVFASPEGEGLGLRGRLPTGKQVSALGATADAALEGFRSELETEAHRVLGGQWLAVPVAEADPVPGQMRLDRDYVLLPIDALSAGLDVLGELRQGDRVAVPDEEA